jgi:hypothetical protein
MTRWLVSWLLGASMMVAWGEQAVAVELPLRKAGLWEMKLVRTGSPLPEMTTQHCTDATTDKDMATASSPMSKEVCSKREVQQSASGYVMDSVCSIAGVSMTTHSEITGDFDSAYTIRTTMHSDVAAAGSPKDATTTIEAKWLGACKAGQKPGDIVMPGGFKLNVKDAEKLKGLLPK